MIVEVEGFLGCGSPGVCFKFFKALQDVLDRRQVAGRGFAEELLHAGAHDGHRLGPAIDTDGNLFVRLAQKVGREGLRVLRSLRTSSRIAGPALLESRILR